MMGSLLPFPLQISVGGRAKLVKPGLKASQTLKPHVASINSKPPFPVTNFTLLSAERTDGNLNSEVKLSGKWAIQVESRSIKISDVVLEEICARPMHMMGWFSPVQTKAWEFTLPLTKTSARTGTSTLTDPAWALMEQPGWVFKLDNQERTVINVVACRKAPL